jgi:hypothetical protein
VQTPEHIIPCSARPVSGSNGGCPTEGGVTYTRAWRFVVVGLGDELCETPTLIRAKAV